MRPFCTCITLCVAILFMAGCKKDPVPATLVSSSGIFSATIDGLPFNSDPFSLDSATGRYLGNYALVVRGNPVQLSLIGQKDKPSDTSHNSISFFTAAVAVGSYSSNATGAAFCAFKYARGAAAKELVWNTDFFDSGVVNITKLDTLNKLVSGTFSFTGFSNTATPSKHLITQGSFADVPIVP